MPGNTSCTFSLRVGLDFGKTKSDQTRTVLFVVCVWSAGNFQGFRLNTTAYSAHAHEKEVLFMEGVKVHVMGVEDVLIDNSKDDKDQEDPFWADFNGKTITIVYLYHDY